MGDWWARVAPGSKVKAEAGDTVKSFGKKDAVAGLLRRNSPQTATIDMGWNDPQRTYGDIEEGCNYGGVNLKARSIPHLVELQAELRGDATFIQTWDDGLKSSISFVDFNRRVISAADLLQANYGIKRGDHCAILSHNSTEYLALSIGIMRSQAVSVNLNWRSPAANLVQLVEKSKCTIVFATHHFEEVAQVLAACVHVVYIEDMELHKPVTSDRSRKFTIPCQPTDNAVIFFTSGSTSLPKAVPHTHASLMWLQHQYYAAFPAPYQTTDPNAGTLCFFPYFHVSSRRMPMCTHHALPHPPTHSLARPRTPVVPPHPPLLIRPSSGDGL
jgi:long-subunit acyl-CoA synthetase (AMP-forming)